MPPTCQVNNSELDCKQSNRGHKFSRHMLGWQFTLVPCASFLLWPLCVRILQTTCASAMIGTAPNHRPITMGDFEHPPPLCDQPCHH
jgi:hypothetical protein